MQSKLNPEIEKLADKDLSKDIEQFKKIAELDPFNRYLTYDSKLEGESDESYQYRHIKKEGEDEEQFKKRKQKR
jgi:hypothetical protein